MIYTTNTVEDIIVKYVKSQKTRAVFPNNTALEKLVYLAYRNIRRNGPCH
ncbi:transposase [Bacteroides sp. 4_1_36]|nr:transposase [Bacteroides sp. 4_1_36]